jgi:hypothetical protein
VLGHPDRVDDDSRRYERRELAVEIAPAETDERIELARDDRLDDVTAPPPHVALRERSLDEQTEAFVLRFVHAQHVGADHRVERRLVPLIGVRRVALQHVDALTKRVHGEEAFAGSFGCVGDTEMLRHAAVLHGALS